MKCRSLVILLTAVATPAAPAKDPMPMDRTIAKEPAYRSKAPRYSLLVFGRETHTRVWFVLDGDDLYVDRNGNGDLTEIGKRFPVKERSDDGEEFGEKVQLRSYQVGAITESDGKTKHPGATFTFKRVGKGPAHLRSIVVDLGSFTEMVVAESLALGDRPETAPAFHFNGPLTIGSFVMFLSRAQANDLRVHIQTPALGKDRPAMVSCTSVPNSVHPIAAIEFPHRKQGKKPIRIRVSLRQRC